MMKVVKWLDEHMEEFLLVGNYPQNSVDTVSDLGGGVLPFLLDLECVSFSSIYNQNGKYASCRRSSGYAA